MGKTLLLVVLVATAACGAYRFPGSGSGTGTVHGQVTTVGCGGPGPVQPAAGACPANPASDCLPQPPNRLCAEWPIPGIELVFANGNTTLRTKTDSAGAYSIELPVGTWKVSTANFVRLISGPQNLVVSAGASIVADYIVDIGIRAAA
jgi:hypothetical protein